MRLRYLPFVVFAFIMAAAPAPSALFSQSRSTAEPSASKAYGSKSAPITMEVFSDYQCPACRGLYEGTLRQLINDYVASGKVYLIHRDYPLKIHNHSMEAARYANAAAHVGKFEQVEAALYDHQADWGSDGNIEKYVAAVLTPTQLRRVNRMMEGCHSETAQVQPAKATAGEGSQNCAMDAAIDHDMSLGAQVPVQQTPTFVITYKGQRSTTAGIVSYAILKQYFDSLLSQ